MKSKYDIFLLYDELKDKLILMSHDVKWNDISEWWHYDGEKSWWTTGNKYLSTPEFKKYQIIDRCSENSDRLK